MNNTLVIYYSYEGNTKFAADVIKDKLNTDILELKPKKAVKDNMGAMKYFWLGKDVAMKVEPELEDINIDFSKYENIFIGTPVWAFTITPPIRSFLNKYRIQNKNIYLFATYEGMIGSTFKAMRALLKDNSIISENSFAGVNNRKEEIRKQVEGWINEIQSK